MKESALQQATRILQEIDQEITALGLCKNPNALTPGRFGPWLLSEFMPAARKSVESGHLPEVNGIGLAAVREFEGHSEVPEANKLCELLCKLEAVFKMR